MKINFGSIFGTTFFSVLAALVLYDLIVKGLIAKVFPNTYDQTDNAFNHFAEPRTVHSADVQMLDENTFVIGGKTYRFREAA